MRDTLRERYFQWLAEQVMNEASVRYQKLLRRLHATPFTYTVPMDGNREADGIELRYRYGYAFAIPGPEIAAELDNAPCSVLEMMAALCFRCDEILFDAAYGPRAVSLFRDMLDSLGLEDMDDVRYDESRVDDILRQLLARRYAENGAGGLFTVRDPPGDLRQVELWCQAMWWLDQFV